MNSTGLRQIDQIERSRLSGEIAKRLEKAIHEGRFLPGERLAPERVLSDDLGVSRPVLREALGILESRGLICIQHGRGTFVKDLASELLNAPTSQWLARNEKLVREFYEARLVVEPECAALASERATPEKILILRQILDRADHVIEDGKIIAFIGLDIDFHSAIAEMTGNGLLFQMLHSIINPDTDLRKVLHRLSGQPTVAQARHNRILAAIESGNPVEARREMSAALRGALQDIGRLLEQGEVVEQGGD